MTSFADNNRLSSASTDVGKAQTPPPVLVGVAFSFFVMSPIFLQITMSQSPYLNEQIGAEQAIQIATVAGLYVVANTRR